MKRRRLLAIAIALIIAVGVAVIRHRIRKLKEGSLSEPIKRGAMVESVYGIGTVTATRSYQLKSGVTSQIKKLYVKEGDQVKAGDRLVDLASTALFRAPFDGTVTWLPFKEYETVFSGSVVLNLVDLHDRYVIVSLEQRAALRVRNGMSAKISFDSLRGDSFGGRVESIYSNDNNFLVRIGINDLPPQILPGMTGDVGIAISEKPDVLMIPVAAIQDGTVQVNREDHAVPVEVKTGVVDGSLAELVAGDLKEGERLMIKKKLTK